mgnify:CR=1 FL=1
MMKEINNENAYSDTVNKLASLLVELSNEIVPADIEKEKSTHSLKNNFKVCGDLKKTCKCKNKDHCQAVQFQQCFTEDYRNEFVTRIHNLTSMKAIQEVNSGKLHVQEVEMRDNEKKITEQKRKLDELSMVLEKNAFSKCSRHQQHSNTTKYGYHRNHPNNQITTKNIIWQNNASRIVF